MNKEEEKELFTKVLTASLYEVDKQLKHTHVYVKNEDMEKFREVIGDYYEFLHSHGYVEEAEVKPVLDLINSYKNRRLK